MDKQLLIIGGGLAGCEAALTAAAAGVPVTLWEMKPDHMSPAHQSPLLGELVCSNSLRSDMPTSAVGLLKAEMEALGSFIMQAARATAIKAGKALAVDRGLFAAELDRMVRTNNVITVETHQANAVPGPEQADLCILATGPLTTGPLAEDLGRLTGAEHLHFYDAIAPIVTADSVDMDHAFWQDRYSDEPGDYLNCPMNREEFSAFYQALTSSEQTLLHDFEEPKFFEGCLPIEVMAARGDKTLLFGPMKPVGLRDSSGQRPFAVVQLRKEDAAGSLLNLVGFQTKLTRPSQDKVFRLIPALRGADFVRTGSIHRNSFVDAPRVLDPTLRLNTAPHVMIAGQLSGVEGYVESSAMGLLCGLNAVRILSGADPVRPPATTAMGGLLSHLANTATKDFQPSNVNFGLLPPFEKRIPKRQRKAAYARRALADLYQWIKSLDMSPAMEMPKILD